MILLLFCTLLTCFYSYNTLASFFKLKEINGYIIFKSMYAFMYGLYPLLMSFVVEFCPYDSHLITSVISYKGYGYLALLYFYFLAFLGFAVFDVFYNKFNVKLYNSKIILNCYDSEVKLSSKIGWICFLIGSVSFYLWGQSYGSIQFLMENAAAARSGILDSVSNTKFFKRPATLLFLSSLIFFSICYTNYSIKNIKNSITNYIGLFLSLFLTCLYLICNDGRLTIILYLLSLLWITTLSLNKRKLIKVLFVSSFIMVVLLCLILNLDYITYFIRHGEILENSSDKNILYAFIAETIFWQKGAQTAIMARFSGDVGFTIFDDLMTGAMAWLPYSLKITGFEDVWDINTKLIYGDISITHGQMPCDLITQAFYDLDIIGVLLYNMFLGIIIKKVDLCNKSYSCFSKAIMASVMVMIMRMVPYFSFYDIISSLFKIVIGYSIYILYKKVKISS